MKVAQAKSSGRFNRRIQIQVEQTARQPLGSLASTWQTVATVWASIDIQNSSLIYETSAFMETATYRITMRYQKSLRVEPGQRVQYVDAGSGITHIYRINTVVNTAMANVELVLLCTEFGSGQ